jgi:NADP-dependent 3-hydroxy acid dehydrogenase YdfG
MVVEKTISLLGRIDVVVAAAGHGKGHGSIVEADTSQWNNLVETNLMSAMHLSVAVAPALRDSGGSLIFVGSVSALEPASSFPAYAATKHALRGFVSSIQRTSGDRFRISMINPGTTNTEFSAVALGLLDPTPPDPAKWGFSPLFPEDVAKAIAWIIDQPEHVHVTELTIRSAGDFG